MNRQSRKYEIYSRWPVFFWQECVFCNKEFRREPMYELMLWNSSVHSCTVCSPTKRDFEKKWARAISTRPPAPKAPPPRKP